IARDASEKKKHEPLPVLTVKIADVNSLLAVAKKVAAAVGVDGDEFDQNVSIIDTIEGINKKEPLGLVFRSNGEDFNDPLFIAPINDLEKFSLPNIPFKFSKIADGKFRAAVSPALSFIGYQKEGYAVIVPETSSAPIPANPKALLADLDKYKLGFKVELTNTTYDAVSQILAPLIMFASMTDPDAAENLQNTIELCEPFFDEYKNVILGYAVDAKTLDVVGEVKVEASKDSKILSKIIDFGKNRKTNFAGIKTKNTPVLYANDTELFTSGYYPDPDTYKEVIDILEKQFALIAKGALDSIKEMAESEAEEKNAEIAVNSLQKIILSLYKQDKIDYAAWLDTEGTGFFALNVSEAGELDKFFDAVINVVKARHAENDDSRKELEKFLADNLKRNYKTIAGYSISSLKIPFAEIAQQHGASDFPKLKIGNTYNLFAAISDKKAVVLAGGVDADKTEAALKTALEATADAATPKQPTMLFDLQAVGQLLNKIGVEAFAKEEQDKEAVKDFLAIINNVGNTSKITVTNEVKDSTIFTSLKIDGSVIFAIAKLVKTAREYDGKIIPAQEVIDITVPEDE
ncbi:MAG: hypothetical protein LBQ66_03660, partial [Planctomycetaceae bacterium]|nr:hypothetical protein [Planctomycetaceae bacterium]